MLADFSPYKPGERCQHATSATKWRGGALWWAATRRAWFPTMLHERNADFPLFSKGI
jgi:hypothetical protein